jgi:hypothetical protein
MKGCGYRDLFGGMGFFHLTLRSTKWQSYLTAVASHQQIRSENLGLLPGVLKFSQGFDIFLIRLLALLRF